MLHDDFDTQVQPEEFHEDIILMEDIMDDNPIDEDYFDNDNFDEGSDRDNWEEEQVFQDSQHDW